MRISGIIVLSIIAVGLISCNRPTEYTLENRYIKRSISIANESLHTVEIYNKLDEKKIVPDSDSEFRLRISEGTHLENTDQLLTSSDFKVEKVLSSSPSSIAILLINEAKQLDVEVHYELERENFYAHKYLIIRSEKDITLERIDVEVIKHDDIYQPYTIKQITAQGRAKWRPGLGQPLYTNRSGIFMGIEFPASYNYVNNNTGYCGYLWGKEVQGGDAYTSYKSVIGVSENPDYIQNSFFKYIDEIRIRPFRLQVQYNSWFDWGGSVSQKLFGASVKKINQELVEERGLASLDAYVIDDGWQDLAKDWTEKTWRVNHKFDSDFSASIAKVEEANSSLGLWMSPGCLFGAQPAVKQYKKQGFQVLDNWMSMAGPEYMQLLEDRILELTREGVTYFKLDGLFGHLNTREFELNGQDYGVPSMPQLGTDSLSASDSLLNESKFDELKTYYLVAGTERLIQIFKKQHKVNPNVYVVISNGAYLSPWWLMYIDAVWMINAGDAASGSNRTQELVYRDAKYYDIWHKENTQYPMYAIFNHEPKKVRTGESKETFAEYLWMNLSRGTGFIELYIKPRVLSESDWDVLAEGLQWAHKSFRFFKHVRMHGGDPGESEVYGYSAWTKDGGYMSFHNPSEVPKTYHLVLNRSKGLTKTNTNISYEVSSPLHNSDKLVNKNVKFGDDLVVSLEPGEVKVFDFRK